MLDKLITKSRCPSEISAILDAITIRQAFVSDALQGL